jgi:hypothetical protein
MTMRIKTPTMRMTAALIVFALVCCGSRAGWAQDLSAAYDTASGDAKAFKKDNAPPTRPRASEMQSPIGHSATLNDVEVVTFRFSNGQANSFRYNFALFDAQNGAGEPELKALVTQFQALALESYDSVDRFCTAKTGLQASASFDNLYTKNIVFLKNTPEFDVRRGNENAGIAARNFFLFVPRLLEKGLVYGIYRVDNAVTGYETFNGAAESVKLHDQLKPSYSVKLDPAVGWQHFGWFKGDEVKTIYISADEVSMKRALIGYFRANVCYGTEPDWSQISW